MQTYSSMDRTSENLISSRMMHSEMHVLTQTRSTDSLQKPAMASFSSLNVRDDLAYYYADLRCTHRLTDEERQDLLTRIPTIPTQDGRRAAKQQLIESYLPLAKYLAFKLCPPFVSHRRLPDLIGVANLTLVEIIEGRDLTAISDLTSYLTVCLQGALKEAHLRDGLLMKLSRDAFAHASAEERGRILYIASLDALMRLDEDNMQEEPYVAPITPTTQIPEHDPIKRAKVEEYLSYLPQRSQMILRMRFGLSDEDEREYGVTEIAARLGLSREAVNTTVQYSIDKLRALAEGKATIIHRGDRACISYPKLFDRPLKPEQEAALQHACTELEAEGISVTECHLARATGISFKLIRSFLHIHRPQSSRGGERDSLRQRRLEEAYSRLTAQGRPIAGAALAREAHVDDRVARRFLKEQRRATDATA